MVFGTAIAAGKVSRGGNRTGPAVAQESEEHKVLILMPTVFFWSAPEKEHCQLLLEKDLCMQARLQLPLLIHPRHISVAGDRTSAGGFA